MSVPIRIRAYNVRFGDCVLVSIGGAPHERHVLFDFGNAPGGVKRQGGKNDVFAPIARDIRERTRGTIDLVVMTHEHLDHMEGFYSEKAIFDTLKIGRLWMSLMSEPGYYKKYRNAEQKKFALAALAVFVNRWQARGRFAIMPDPMQALIGNNNVLDLTNQQRIDYLRTLVPKSSVHYLARGARLQKRHDLGANVKVEVLAPEKDASIYYGGTRGSGLSLESATRLAGTPKNGKRRSNPGAPPHMAPDEFERLKDEVAELDIGDIFAIDKAQNNPRLVVRITVGGKTLLFCGDAEEESWALMKAKRLLGPVDFLKVAHHGSVNGMPFDGAHAVLDTVLKKGKRTIALVSTCRGAYPARSEATVIPSARLMTLLQQRCKRVVNTENDAPLGGYVDITI